MRKRQLAAWSVLFIVALMLLGGCTQLDSPEKVAHALMSIVLPPPDAEAEPSPTEAIALNQTTAISTTATPLEANVAETATPALVVSTTVPLAQTAVATVGAENAESAAPDETEVLTVGELRTRQATTQQPLTETVELTDTQAISGAVSISSTLSMSDTLSVPSSELVSDTESVTDTLSITGTVPVTSAVPVTGTAMVAPTTSVSATVDVRTVGDVAATIALAKAQQLVTIVTDGSRLNVRSEAANDAAIVGKLTPDAVVEVLDSTADAAWLQVAFDEAGATGWIAAQFTQPVESESSVANGQLVSAANSPSDDEPVAPIVLAPTEVTSTMTTSVSVTTSVSITGALPITSSKALTSSVVVTPASSGAVTSTLLATLSLTEALQSTIAVAPTEPTAITKPANMNVRRGPGTNYPVATVATAGSQFKILALSPNGEWYQVELPDEEEPAWVYSPLVDAAGPMEKVSALSEEEIPVPPEPVIAPASAAASGAPPPSGAGFFGYGVQAHMLGGGINEAVNSTAEMGFNWLKQQVEWRAFEGSPGAIDFSELRRIVDAASGRGINVLFSVVNSPPWAREPGFDPNVGGPPADPQTYANFVGRMAGEFCGSGLKAIEVWNEQNLHYEWGNKPLNPADYMNLLRAAYGSIKAACPSMLVISGAPTPAGDAGGIARDDFAYLEGMYQNGLANYADGIGVHPSGYNVPPNVRHEDACAVIQGTGNQFNGPCDTPHHSWSFRSTMEGYRNIMVVYGDANKRLWPTEFGWAAGGAFHPAYAYANDNDFEEQAAWTVEAYQMMRNWGWVGPAFLWNLNFRVIADGTEKAQWGIVRNDYGPLPVYNALRSMGK